jgi:hypothetical protein
MATRKSTTTAVAVKKPSNVIAIQESLKNMAASLAERIQPGGGNKIRLSKDKQFVLPDGTKTEGPLELVIVDFVATNSFYAGKFDANNPAPPNCFAVGTNIRAMVPVKESPEIQNDNCAECPMNAWGSDGTGKACKNGRRLAVLPPDADADTPLWLLDVSPTALKGFDGYVAGVVRTFGMPPIAVVTQVSMDDQAEYQRLVFSDPKPNENLAVAHARMDEARELLVALPDFSGLTATKKPAPRKTAGRR